MITTTSLKHPSIRAKVISTHIIPESAVTNCILKWDQTCHWNREQGFDEPSDECWTTELMNLVIECVGLKEGLMIDNSSWDEILKSGSPAIVIVTDDSRVTVHQ